MKFLAGDARLVSRTECGPWWQEAEAEELCRLEEERLGRVSGDA